MSPFPSVLKLVKRKLVIGNQRCLLSQQEMALRTMKWYMTLNSDSLNEVFSHEPQRNLRRTRTLYPRVHQIDGLKDFLGSRFFDAMSDSDTV